MAAIKELASGSVPDSMKMEWTNDGAYRFLVEVTPDDDGIYSAIALNLPGTGSCGATEEKALERFAEAAIGMIESYLESGKKIPWKEIEPAETPAEAKWISINV